MYPTKRIQKIEKPYDRGQTIVSQSTTLLVMDQSKPTESQSARARHTKKVALPAPTKKSKQFDFDDWPFLNSSGEDVCCIAATPFH